MSIIEAEVEVDETDIPNVKIGQLAGNPPSTRHDRQDFTAKVTEIGNSPIQTKPDRPPRRRPTSRSRCRWTARSPTCARLHVHHRDRHGLARERAGGADSGHHRSRDGAGRQGGQSSASRSRRARGVQAAGLRRPSSSPGRSARKIEGVFVVRDGKAVFEVVEQGVAVKLLCCPGLKDGDSGDHRSVQLGAMPGGRRCRQAGRCARGRPPPRQNKLFHPDRRRSPFRRSGRTTPIVHDRPRNIVAVTSIIAVVSLIRESTPA